jgi:hypothetical protein
MKTGRPRKNIDAKRVIDLASKGMTQNEIAAFCDCSSSLLDKRFSEALKTGRELLSASLKRKQVEKALSGDNTMLIWCGKQFCGQKEKQEVTGADGGPLSHVVHTIRFGDGNRDS